MLLGQGHIQKESLCLAHMLLRQPFAGSEGILFAAVLESPESAVPVISYGIAVVRSFLFLCFVQQNIEE